MERHTCHTWKVGMALMPHAPATACMQGSNICLPHPDARLYLPGGHVGVRDCLVLELWHSQRSALLWPARGHSYLIGINIHCQEDQGRVGDAQSGKDGPNEFAWSAPACICRHQRCRNDTELKDCRWQGRDEGSPCCRKIDDHLQNPSHPLARESACPTYWERRSTVAWAPS